MRIHEESYIFFSETAHGLREGYLCDGPRESGSLVSLPLYPSCVCVGVGTTDRERRRGARKRDVSPFFFVAVACPSSLLSCDRRTMLCCLSLSLSVVVTVTRVCVCALTRTCSKLAKPWLWHSPCVPSFCRHLYP